MYKEQVQINRKCSRKKMGKNDRHIYNIQIDNIQIYNKHEEI